MFSSIKKTIESILPWRSNSVLVESKAKKISLKRDHSLKKAKQIPEEVYITPKKIVSFDPEDLYDEGETIGKGKSKVRRININKNYMKEEASLQVNSNILGNSQSRMQLSDSETPPKIDKKSYELSIISQNQQQISQPIFSSIKEYSVKNKCMSGESLEQLLNASDLDYLMIKIKREKQSNKKQLTAEIKRKRIEEYQRNKEKALKHSIRTQCIICEQKTDSKDSIQLTCCHKIHRICSDIIRWKPKMKCSKCERKSVKKIIFHLSQEKLTKKIQLSLKKQKK